MKRFLKSTITLCSIALLGVVHAQQIGSITPVLIGSSGNYSVNGNISISSSTGECIVHTTQNGPYVLTQGFQQPSANGTLALTSTVVYYDVTCLGAMDGTASITANGGSPPYSYSWTTSAGDTFATNDSIPPGTYTVTVTDAGNLSQTHTFTILEGTGICDIQMYHGITPNGDGFNDTWVIDYIDLHTPNTVTVFNRWGVEVWHGENYDNVNVVWDGRSMDGNELTDGTYFVIVKVGDVITKDWIELTH